MDWVGITKNLIRLYSDLIRLYPEGCASLKMKYKWENNNSNTLQHIKHNGMKMWRQSWNSDELYNVWTWLHYDYIAAYTPVSVRVL